MRNAINRLLTCLALLLVSTAVIAADDDTRPGNAVGARGFLSTDSEGFDTRRVALEYFPRYQNANSFSGMRYTTHSYQQNSWSRIGQQLALVHRNVDPATANGWNLDAGWFQQEGRGLFALEGNYHRALAAHTGLDLFINRDWLETPPALDKGVHFTLAGAALEQGLGAHVTLVGFAARQDFSDGNARNHGRFKFIYQPDLDSGLTLQARYRRYNSTSSDVGGAYFNPEDYDETMLALGWRKKIQGWNLNFTGGLGKQKVDSDPYASTYLLEAGLQSPPWYPYTVRVRAAVNQMASFFGPDYRYNYLQAEWIIPF